MRRASVVPSQHWARRNHRVERAVREHEVSSETRLGKGSLHRFAEGATERPLVDRGIPWYPASEELQEGEGTMEQHVSVVRTVRQRRPGLTDRWDFCRGSKATARVTHCSILVIDSEPRTVLDSFGRVGKGPK